MVRREARSPSRRFILRSASRLLPSLSQMSEDRAGGGPESRRIAVNAMNSHTHRRSRGFVPATKKTAPAENVSRRRIRFSVARAVGVVCAAGVLVATPAALAGGGTTTLKATLTGG